MLAALARVSSQHSWPQGPNVVILECASIQINETPHRSNTLPQETTRTTTTTMVRIPQFLTAALAITGASAASAVKDLLPSNFDDIVLNSGKPALVEFFAPWCGHCKTLAPIYEELAHAFEHSDKLTIAKVDADAHKDLGRKHGVQGFPTLKWFENGKVDDYKGGRDLESLVAFVSGKTGVQMKAKKKEKSNVEMLTDSTFKEKVGGEKDVLVAFTAPWCGREYTMEDRAIKLKHSKANYLLRQTARPSPPSGSS